MDSSNENFNQINDKKSERIDTHDIFKSLINNNDSKQIYENIFQSYSYNSVSDSGDIINYSNSNILNNYQDIHFNHNEEKKEAIMLDFHDHIKTKSSFIIEHPLTYINNEREMLVEKELTMIDNEKNLNLSEKIDLNLYKSSSQLFIHNKSKENQLNMYNLTYFCIDYCINSNNLILPKFIQNSIESSNSFQQLWSSQVSSMKLIDSNTSESTLSILGSLIILIFKLIITGLYILYSYTKIFQYDTLLFCFCYLLGILFGMNVYFFINFFLIIIYIISICMIIYEKCLLYYIDSNIYGNNIEYENHYWKRIKLILYGFITGIISTFII